MNLPSYIDLDQEYFKVRAEKKLRKRGFDDYALNQTMVQAQAFSDWSDYQKFFANIVWLGDYVPCSVKLPKPEKPLGFESAGIPEDELLIMFPEYEGLCLAYEQSGKPLEKPELYYKYERNDDVVYFAKDEWLKQCKEYHEAEQRMLFAGWTVLDKNEIESHPYQIGFCEEEIKVIERLGNGKGDGEFAYDEDLRLLEKRPITILKFQLISEIPLPFNESNKTIQKLFLSEVKV